MPFAPMNCSIGSGPPVTLPVSSVIPLAPFDDSVDTNEVIVQGTGTITSFGPCPFTADDDGDPDQPWQVTKRVTFVPVGGPIILTYGAGMNLLGGVSRTIANRSIGEYYGDVDGWVEQSFVDTVTGGGGGGGTVGPPGPPGPTAVSTDTPNMAGLGSDGLLFVRDAPSDSHPHGRMNQAWTTVLLAPLDGGNF